MTGAWVLCTLLAAGPGSASPVPSRAAPAGIADGKLRGLSDDRGNIRAEALEAGIELNGRGTLEFDSPLVWPFFLADEDLPAITLPAAPFVDGTIAPYLSYQKRKRNFSFVGRYDGNVSARGYLLGVSPFGQHNLTTQADLGNPARDLRLSTTMSLQGGTSDVADAALSLGTPAGLDQTLGLFSYLAINLGTTATKQFDRRTFGTTGVSVAWLGGGGSDQTPGLPLWQALGLPLSDPTGSIAPQMQPRAFVRTDHILTRRLTLSGEADAQAVWTLDDRQFFATSAVVDANYRLTRLWSVQSRTGVLTGAQFDMLRKTDTWLTAFPIAQLTANYSTRSATSLGDSVTLSAGLYPQYDAFLGGLTERLDVTVTAQVRASSRLSVVLDAQAAQVVWVLGDRRAGVTLPRPGEVELAPVSSLSPWQPLPDPRASHHVGAARAQLIWQATPGVSVRAGATGSASARWPYWPVLDNFALRGAVFVGLIARSTLFG